MKYLLTIVVSIVSVVSAYGQKQNSPYAEAYIESKHLIPGEQTILWVRVQGGQPDGRPKAPEVEGAAINFIQAVARIDADRRLTQVYAYRVSAPNPGKYVIPSIAISSNGKRLLSDPLVFHVHPESNLATIPTGIKGNDVKIGWFPAKTTLYQGEVCPVVLKVYSPTSLRIASFGLPDPQKVNCLAWRFSLPNKRQSSTVAIDGMTYQVVRYATTLSGIAPGKATLGPSKLRLIIRERIIDPRIGPRLVDKPIPLILPELNFNILPLPPGAPEYFDGAVGSFQVRAESQKLSLRETDSTEVILYIEGTGNLPTLKAPSLSGETWKIIDTSKVTRGEERRYTTGRVTFRQLLRPTSASVSSIPPYQFSYFDPNDQSYHNLETAPIPVSITAVAKPAQKTPVTSSQPNQSTPPEKMQDIIGFIGNPDLEQSQFSLHKSPVYHLVPALLIVIVIIIALRQRHQRILRSNPDAEEKKRALKQLAEASDTRTFYRRAGRIIDQWNHAEENKQLQEILSERDAICFQPDENIDEEISTERRKRIISTLRQSTKLITLLAILTLVTELTSAADTHPGEQAKADSSSAIDTARDAWKTGNYQQALTIYQEQYPDSQEAPADVLFNIGNCHYRLDQPGLAALAWRRALQSDPTHHQARQNLRFIEIKQNASVPETYPWQKRIAAVNSNTYYTILYTCAWVMVISTLIMLLYLKNKTVLVTTTITVCMAGLLSAAAGFALAFYPDGLTAGPPEKQAVILSSTPLYDEAHRHSKEANSNKEKTTLKPASLVHVNAQRGPWIHITTMDQEEGWVETKHLAKVIGKTTGN